MTKLKFMGAQPTLYSANKTAYFEDVIEFSDEEAAYRLEKQPGMWSKVDAPAKKKTPVIGSKKKKE